MSNPDEYTWYANVSPLNRYLLFDLFRVVCVGALIIGAAQVFPLSIVIRDFVTDVGGVVLIIYLFSTVMRRFSAFSGVSIRFILDGSGSTVMEDHEASGMRYVTEQLSSLRWDPMHAGSFRSEKIKPTVIKLPWSEVSRVSEDRNPNVITLHSGSKYLRLFCNEDNYVDVLRFVGLHVNR